MSNLVPRHDQPAGPRVLMNGKYEAKQIKWKDRQNKDKEEYVGSGHSRQLGNSGYGSSSPQFLEEKPVIQHPKHACQWHRIP